MNPGNFLLVQPTKFDIIGKLIEEFTQSGFYHAALVSGKDTVIEALPRGVEERQMKYKYYIEYEVLNISDVQRKTAVKYARDKVGAGYDWVKDLGFAANAFLELFGEKPIHDLWHEHGKFICSSLVDMSFRGAGIVLRPELSPGDITPASLMYTPKVHYVGGTPWEID